MAQHQIGDVEAEGIVSRARAVAGSVATTGSMFAAPTNYDTVSAMDARLIAINAGWYTQTRLDAMTANDKVYAIRLNDDLNTV